MIQGKKFISPGAWFTMVYPSDWNEFEDGEGSFLFYNPDTWTGNFRISAFKADAATRGAMDYGKEAVKQELKENPSASLVKIGKLACAYSKEMFITPLTFGLPALGMWRSNVRLPCLKAEA